MKLNLMKSDGNGGVNIPHWFLVVIVVAVGVISSVAGIVTANVTMKNDISYAKEQITDNVQEIRDIQKLSTECAITIASVETKLESIEHSLERIENTIGN